MADKVETQEVDGVVYFKDHSGLWANAQTNPVVDLSEPVVEAPEVVVDPVHLDGVEVAETPVQA